MTPQTRRNRPLVAQGMGATGETMPTLGSARGMTRLRRRLSELAVACVTAVALTGCGSIDGIELNGKIFDALGVSTGSLGQRPEPKVAQRSPLVLPPDANKLPEPGSAPAPVVAANNQNWPVDRDQKKVADAEEAKRKQDEHCRDGNWKEKAMKDEVAASQGPSGGCGSIFSALSKTLFGKEE